MMKRKVDYFKSLINQSTGLFKKQQSTKGASQSIYLIALFRHACQFSFKAGLNGVMYKK